MHGGPQCLHLRGTGEADWRQERGIQSYSYPLVIRKSSLLRNLHSHFAQKCAAMPTTRPNSLSPFLALTQEIGALGPLSIIQCLSRCWSHLMSLLQDPLSLTRPTLVISGALTKQLVWEPDSSLWVSDFLRLLPELGFVSSQGKLSSSVSSEDEKTLWMDGGDGCTMLQVDLMPLNYTFWNG